MHVSASQPCRWACPAVALGNNRFDPDTPIIARQHANAASKLEGLPAMEARWVSMGKCRNACQGSGANARRIYKEIGPGRRVALSKLALEKFEETGRPLRIAIDTSIWLFQIQASKGMFATGLRML